MGPRGKHGLESTVVYPEGLINSCFKKDVSEVNFFHCHHKFESIENILVRSRRQVFLEELKELVTKRTKSICKLGNFVLAVWTSKNVVGECCIEYRKETMALCWLIVIDELFYVVVNFVIQEDQREILVETVLVE